MRMVFANLGLKAWLFLVGLTPLIARDPARAQPYDLPATWGGDILSRARRPARVAVARRRLLFGMSAEIA
jgi:hypothetical protein